MASKYPPVVSAFDTKATAENAIDALKDAGFSNDEILYATSAKESLFSNLKGWFTGDDQGINEVAKGLMNMGISEDAAHYYAHEYETGHPIIAVESPGHEQSAENILRQSGGHSYGYGMASGASGASGVMGGTTQDTGMPSYSAQSQMGTTPPSGSQSYKAYGQQDYERTEPPSQSEQPYAGSAREQERTGETRPPNTDATRQFRTMESGETRIPLREEQLRADKEQVQTGEVTIHKDIVTEQRSINVPVSREEVVINRKQASSDQPMDTSIGENETIRIPISEEQVNISKETVSTGEVEISKRTYQDEQEYSDTVRREEINMDQEGDVRMWNDDDESLPRR